MTVFVEAADIGSAWTGAFAHLLTSGEVSNLVVNISSPSLEDLGVRREIEQTIIDISSTGNSDFKTPQSMDTVASTIFPSELYTPGPEGAARFFRNVRLGESARQHSKKRRWGTYIGRMVDYPARDGKTTAQLEIALDRLRSTKEWSDLYEIPILSPEVDTASLVLHGDARVDPLRIGGPCLSHISLTRLDGRLNVIALYRRHHYYLRAYGNFLGLARLQSFLAAESSLEVGDLTVITGHAVAEGTGRKLFMHRALSAASGPTPIEFTARPLGSSFEDLALPASARS
jgi:hypothetical protein